MQKRNIILLIASTLFFSCATVSGAQEASSTLSTKEEALTQKIVEAAKSFVGKDSLLVNGRKFRSDCTGVVSAAYFAADIDLWPIMEPYKGNGVTRLYLALNDKNLMAKSPFPTPGDLIFWDNTYDKNGNGKRDDYLTHVGLVISADNNGNIEYFHDLVNKGFVIEKMNLINGVNFEIVDGKRVIVNNYIRAPRNGDRENCLAADLCRGFGSAWKFDSFR